MKRRNFIEKSVLLGATALIPLPGYSLFEKTKYKLGLQLFSINNDMNRDALGTLKAVKPMRYKDFEIYGFDGEKGTFYDHPASTFRKMLDDLEFTASSGHFGFSPFLMQPDDALKRFVDQCIDGAHALGLQYITWPWLAPEQRTIDSFKLLSKKLNCIGEQITSAGLGFAYHNHDFEFIEQNGVTGYDIILKETEPALVKLQMDMFWVMHSSKRTPKELIAEQPGRYVMWHIKDMDKVTRDYTELGNGSIDYKKILPDPVASGLEFYYLEQGGNFTTNAMKSAEDSAKYFKEHLERYI